MSAEIEIKSAKPFAVKQSGSRVSMWFSAFGDVDTTIVNFECVDEESAGIAVAVLHVALGLRTKENSFATGLLHQDIEILESKKRHPAGSSRQK